MAPILVEPLSDKAYELLQQLEALNVLRVISVLSRDTPAAAPAPRKWAGALSPEAAASWDKHLKEIRNEWERGI